MFWFSFVTFGYGFLKLFKNLFFRFWAKLRIHSVIYPSIVHECGFGSFWFCFVTNDYGYCSQNVAGGCGRNVQNVVPYVRDYRLHIGSVQSVTKCCNRPRAIKRWLVVYCGFHTWCFGARGGGRVYYNPEVSGLP